MRIAALLGLLFALQTQTFEVASIRPYTGDDGSWSVGPRPGGGFNAERAPLRGVIRFACGLESYGSVTPAHSPLPTSRPS